MQKPLFLLIFGFFSFLSFGQTLDNGLYSIHYALEEGDVYLFLPEKIVSSQPFNGSFLIYPKGSKASQQTKNSKRLNEYTLKLGSTKTSIANRPFGLTAISDRLTVTLFDAKGKALQSNSVIFDAKKPLPANTPLTAPELIVNEKNTTLYGVFDGNINNTSVRINGVSQRVLAESPISLCIRPEKIRSTTATIVVQDGDQQQQTNCNSIYYTLALGPTDLKRGQKTFFDATIHGAGNATRALTFIVSNTTPSIVSLIGGNQQSFSIAPGDAKNGNWSHHFDISSKNTGTFELNTELEVPDTEYPDAQDEPDESVVVPSSWRGQVSNIDCRIYNANYYVSPAECEALGGQPASDNYFPEWSPPENIPTLSVVNTQVEYGENEAEININIEEGDHPEMLMSVLKPLQGGLEAEVKFLTNSESSYAILHRNPHYGRPCAAVVETKMLYSDGSTQTVNTTINFSGNAFFSLAQSPALRGIRREGNKIKNSIKAAQKRKADLETELKNTNSRYVKAREVYQKNQAHFKHLERIDRSLERVRPAFADSLKALVDSLKSFKTRTGGAPNKANKKRIEDNLANAKKAHEDCQAQLKRLQQEQADLSNKKATLREQQKQIHRDMMSLFRSTGYDYAGTTRRDKNGVFHYQYGVILGAGSGKLAFHKGSVPAEIASKISALEKQMKLVTDLLKGVGERLSLLPGEINAKNKECDELAQKVKDAQNAKNRADALIAENQFWNNQIDAICAKIIALLNRLKTWAAIHDGGLLALINNVQCGENMFVQIDRVVARKKVLETGFQGKAANARREMNTASDLRTGLKERIKEEEEKLRTLAAALAANQKIEAAEAAKALAADKQKCNDMLELLGYKGNDHLSPAEVYEISQDVKKAAEEANDALSSLKKVVEAGEEKMGLDPGKAKAIINRTKERLQKVADKLGKIAEYKEAYDKISNVINQLENYNSDGTATQNAVAFGQLLDHINVGLQKLTDRLPVLKVFTAYFEFIVGSYHAIMKGANAALSKQYAEYLKSHKKLNCSTMLDMCRRNGDDVEKIVDEVFKEWIEKEIGGLRRDDTQARNLVREHVKKRLAECCFKRVQAIYAGEH